MAREAGEEALEGLIGKVEHLDSWSSNHALVASDAAQEVSLSLKRLEGSYTCTHTTDTSCVWAQERKQGKSQQINKRV